MTWTTEMPPTPRWVITFPGSISPDAQAHIREMLKDAVDSGKPMVIPEGGVLYDATNITAPYLSDALESTTETLTEIEAPLPWPVALAIAISLGASVGALVCSLFVALQL